MATSHDSHRALMLRHRDANGPHREGRGCVLGERAARVRAGSGEPQTLSNMDKDQRLSPPLSRGEIFGGT